MEDRLVHPNKTEPALIIDLPMEGTVEEMTLDALRYKSLNAKAFNSRVLSAYREVSEAARKSAARGGQRCAS